MKLKLLKFFTKFVLFTVVLVSVSIGVTTGVNWLRNWAEVKYAEATEMIASQFETVRVVQITPEESDKSIAQLIKEASVKHDIPKLLIAALIEQESGSRYAVNRIRFEPAVYARIDKKKFADEEVGRLWASSIGLTQVIPWYHLRGGSADECALDYQELFDPEKNINCGAGILAKCLRAKAHIKDKEARFRSCLLAYNGGSSYPDQVMARISKMALEGVL